MSKRLYLAAPWVDRKEMPARAQLFKDAGYTITWEWWHYDGDAQESEREEFLLDCAQKDAMGVATADAIVVYNTGKSEGKAVEQGIAIGLNKPIIIIGKRGEFSANVFHYLPLYRWVDSQEAALEKLYEVLSVSEVI